MIFAVIFLDSFVFFFWEYVDINRIVLHFYIVYKISVIVINSELHKEIKNIKTLVLIKGVLLVVGELIGLFKKKIIETVVDFFFLHCFQRISGFNFLKKYNMNFLREKVYVFGQCCYGSLVYNFS